MSRRTRIMHKKGQFYIFTAIIICISAFAYLSSSFTPQAKSTEFDSVAQNYINEAPNVINNAIYEKKDIQTSVDEYTTRFISYAKTKNMDIGIAYMLKEDDRIIVVNYLKKEANISSHNTTIAARQSITLNQTSKVNITYDGQLHNFTFGTESIQFKALITME